MQKIAKARKGKQERKAESGSEPRRRRDQTDFNTKITKETKGDGQDAGRLRDGTRFDSMGLGR